MKNREQLKLFHNLSQTYHVTPSSYLGLPSGSWEAFQFDVVCAVVGAEQDKDKDKPKEDLKTIQSELIVRKVG